MSRLAERYDRLYPGVDIPAAQKEERMERMQYRNGLGGTNRRGRRLRGILVPRLPWKEAS